MNKKDPNQSKVFNLPHREPSLGCNLRQIGTPMAAKTQKGILSQKIHLSAVSRV
jgi:hypothetical protein